MKCTFIRLLLGFYFYCVYICTNKKNPKMSGSGRRVYDQVMTIFGTAMVFFYLGLAYFLLFSPVLSYIDITLRTIFAVPLLLYGVYLTSLKGILPYKSNGHGNLRIF